MNEKEMQILGCMADVFKENGFRTEVVNAQEGQHPALLRIEAARTGKVMQDVLFEMCFIPIPMPSEDTKLLQIYATLFNGLPQDTARELKKVCEYCNDFSALGAFGFFEPSGQLYLKHNTILRVDDELEKIVAFIADNFSLALASVSKFIDAFAVIANGVMKMDAALEQGILPQ